MNWLPFFRKHGTLQRKIRSTNTEQRRTHSEKKLLRPVKKIIGKKD